MENSYGIGVKNRYELFLDDAEDPLEVLKVQEQAKEAKKKTKLSEKENKGKTETKGKPAQAVRKGIKETQIVKSLDAAKPKDDNKKIPRPAAVDRSEKNIKPAGESREERNNRRNREDRPAPAASDFTRESREPRERDGPRVDSGEARPRGRGVGRGMGRGRGIRGAIRGGYDNRGKREFDRQSGSDKTRGNYSGVKPVDKREGSGAHNWGNHKDDMDEQLNTTQPQEEHNEWITEKTEVDVAPSTERAQGDAKDVEVGTSGEADTNAEPTEEEPQELTLDEYKKLRGNRAPPTYNIRKAGEGEDMTQWKKMYPISKKKEGEEEDDEDEEYDALEYPQRVGRQKHVLEIDIHFADSRRATRGRGRGGPRGVGRGGPRGASRSTPLSGGGGGGRGGMSPGEGRGSFAGPRDRERFNGDRGERVEREPYQIRATTRQSAPKVDDEHDFPSLG